MIQRTMLEQEYYEQFIEQGWSSDAADDMAREWASYEELEDN